MNVTNIKSVLKNKNKSGFSTFIDETRGEIKKIKWCTRKEVLKYARIVIISALVVGFVTYFADVIIQGTLRGLHWLFRVFF